MSIFGKIGAGALGIGANAFKTNPASSSAILAATLEPIGGAGAGFIESLDLGGGAGEADIATYRAQTDFEDVIAAKQRRMKKLRAMNLMRVAGMMPDVYSQVEAGRRLPKGARMIGGRPRSDLLAELADHMAAGDFEEA